MTNERTYRCRIYNCSTLLSLIDALSGFSSSESAELGAVNELEFSVESEVEVEVEVELELEDSALGSAALGELDSAVKRDSESMVPQSTGSLHIFNCWL